MIIKNLISDQNCFSKIGESMNSAHNLLSSEQANKTFSGKKVHQKVDFRPFKKFPTSKMCFSKNGENRNSALKFAFIRTKRNTY